MDAEKIVKDLTFEEKTKLLTGVQSMNTYTIDRLSVKSVRCADGPHGVRIQPEANCTHFPNVCNLSCAFCPGTKRAKHIMTVDEFSALMPKLRPFSDYLYFHIMGEPLTHPLLPDFIRYARNIGFKPAVTTNGTLLRQRGQELIDAGVYKVNISVHSFEDGAYEDYIRYLTDCAEFAAAASEAGVQPLRFRRSGI